MLFHTIFNIEIIIGAEFNMKLEIFQNRTLSKYLRK